MKKTVLFFNLASESSNEKGLPFIRAAKQLGCKVISVTHEAGSEMLCGDVNEVVPLSKMERLRDLIREHAVDFSMTVNSRLTPWLAREVEASECDCIRSFSENSARTLGYKDRCATYLKSIGLNAVEHWIPTSMEMWSSIPDDVPLLLKPTFSTGAIDTIPFSDKKSLLESLERGIVSETLNQTVSLSQFHDINRESRIFGRWMVQRRIDFKMQIGFEIAVVDGEVTIVHAGEILTEPERKISAYAHVGPIQVAREIEEGVKHLIKSLGIQNANLTPDILVDQNDQWYLIDANLNVGGEGLLSLLEARGLNYPMESLKGFLGLPCCFVTKPVCAASVGRPTFKAGVQPKVVTALTLDALRRTI